VIEPALDGEMAGYLLAIIAMVRILPTFDTSDRSWLFRYALKVLAHVLLPNEPVPGPTLAGNYLQAMLLVSAGIGSLNPPHSPDEATKRLIQGVHTLTTLLKPENPA
jgi:hypothetical protein